MVEYVFARPFVYLSTLFLIAYISVAGSTLEIRTLIFTSLLFFAAFLILLYNLNKDFPFTIIIGIIFLVMLIRCQMHQKAMQEDRSQFYIEKSFKSILVIKKSERSVSKFAIWANLINKPHHPLIELIITPNNKLDYMYSGDTLICTISIQPIKKSSNLLFNSYDSYLYRNHILYRAYLNSNDIVLRKGTSINALSLGQKLAQFANNVLSESFKDSISSGLTKGILLGDKTAITPNQKVLFQNAGLSHILAVSGMHLAVLYAILQWIFQKFVRVKNKFWVNFSYAIILLFLWAFTYTTGLSASAIRACTMISIHIFARVINRKSDPVNTLFCTSFIVQLYDPCIVDDIGYQLSFMAVLGILLFNPYITHVVRSIPYPFRYVAELTGISVSVQCLTLPLTLLYFHNFPLGSFIANIIWVPLSSLILVAGIVIIFLQMNPAISQMIASILQYLISYGIVALEILSRFKYAVISNLWYDSVSVSTYYIIMTLGWGALYLKKATIFIPISMLSILLVCLYWHKESIISKRNEALIYYEGKHMRYDIKFGSVILTNAADSKLMQTYRMRIRTMKIRNSCLQNIMKMLPIVNQIQLITQLPEHAINELKLFDICRPYKRKDLQFHMEATGINLAERHSLQTQPLIYKFPKRMHLEKSSYFKS